MKLAPKPTRMRPPQMKIVMFGDSAMTSSPGGAQSRAEAEVGAPADDGAHDSPGHHEGAGHERVHLSPAECRESSRRARRPAAGWRGRARHCRPTFPICARISTIMGSTRNFSTPPSGCVVLLFAIMSSFNLGWNAYAEKGSLASSLRNSAALIVGRLLPFRSGNVFRCNGNVPFGKREHRVPILLVGQFPCGPLSRQLKPVKRCERARGRE